MINNPYLNEFTKTESFTWIQLTLRTELVKKYSWAIPNQEALDYLVSLSPLIEIGAGTGYWAHLIKQSGGDIIAFDKEPYINSQAGNEWAEVLEGDYTKVADFPNHTLFLCWAPYNDPLAYDCLVNYKGNRLVYIGESEGGCTANDAFYELLSKEWKVHKTISIPQYIGIHDYLTGYVRK